MSFFWQRVVIAVVMIALASAIAKVIDVRMGRRELQAGAMTRYRVLRRVQVVRGIAGAVAADRRDQLPLLPIERAHADAQRKKALGGLAHLGEGAVSLGRSEHTIGHGAGTS